MRVWELFEWGEHQGTEAIQKAVAGVASVLKQHGLSSLDGKLRIFTGDQTHYNTGNDTIYLNWRQFDGDANQMMHALAHEMGHRLMNRLKTRDALKIWWKHVSADKATWHVTEYARKDHREMFAETFRKYLQGDLAGEQTNWMKRFIDKYLQK